MNSRALLPHARAALRYSLRLQSGERVMILWDETVSPEFSEACRIAAEEVGADVSFVVHAPLRYRPLKEYCLFAVASLHPDGVLLPEVPYQAMKASSAIVILSSDMDSLFSPLIDQVLGDGKRILFIPYFDTPTIHRLFPTSFEEVEVQRHVVEKLGVLLRSATTAHVFSAEGTNLRMRLGQRKVRLHTGIAFPGQLIILPAGQATHVPDDGSAEGVVVIDRTVAAHDYKELSDPIMLHVAKGNVVRIDGGADARMLREFLANFHDPRVYHLTELGVGTNPKCRLSGVGAPAEDTHKEGTVSLALGCDTHIGGGFRAPVHIDMTMRLPSLRVGDHLIVSNGRLVSNEENDLDGRSSERRSQSSS